MDSREKVKKIRLLINIKYQMSDLRDSLTTLDPHDYKWLVRDLDETMLRLQSRAEMIVTGEIK